MSSKVGHSIKYRTNKNDIIYTPKPVALKMIEMCDIKNDMMVLDPSKAAGVFFDNLPECKKDWCEITEGRDFFEYNNKVDLIIGNPPYSMWDKWLDHTMKITDKFCYIFGFLNFTDVRLRRIIKNGFGITHIHICKVEWWFGTSVIAIFERGKPSIISIEPTRILCDVCGNYCSRGKKGNSPNICGN